MVKKSWIAVLVVVSGIGAGVLASGRATGSEGAKAADKTATATAKYTKPAIDTSQFKAAPAWSLAGLNGKPLTSKELEGKVVLVDFWATWCGPCRRSIPHLIDLHNEYKDKGLAVVGVSLDQQGPSVVVPFVEKNKIPYSVVLGNQKMVEDFGGVRGIPTAFIISQDGKIVRKIVGLVPREKYESEIKALLGLS